MPVVFTSISSVSFAENGTGVVRNIEASLNGGAADAGLTYSISGGADQALFSVDGTTGELSFVAAPDFEAPGDVGTDNIYNVEVTATDGAAEVNTQALTITVTNDAVEQSLTGTPFATIDLAALDGGNGFVLNGINANDQSGVSVSSAGDVNGDGFDDLIIGARNADPGGDVNAGESYVVFGAAGGFAASLDLSTLDGSNGFVLNGIDASDLSGVSVSSAGDVNGDGFDDLIIGAIFADPNGSYSGESYVVFGAAGGFAASINLSSLDGSNGFVLNGIDANDRSGSSVSSAGDVNGDGFDDLIIGAYRADPNGSSSGESYVVFGAAGGFAASINLSSLDGSNGFVLNGIDAYDRSGVSVSSAGDVNGDGFDDLIIGARNADPNGTYSGESYVVFGAAGGFAASLDLSTLDGSNGFTINGIDASDQSGVSVSSAGDVNGDGFDDLIIGARYADPNGGDSGESYVVFGAAGGFAASLDLSSLDGSTGFVLNGIDASDRSGSSVSSAGDVNGDGFDDLIIGARDADPNGTSSGESYVVFGAAGGFAASINLSSLDGSTGFVLNGIDASDRSGSSVSSAGDVNGDGFDDLIIGASTADPSGSNSGESYLVFGGPSLTPVAFTSLATASFVENGTGVVRNIEATLGSGAADAGLTYSISGGADQALFSVDGTTGELSFVAAPDFEAPGDVGTDNIYNVEVTATDGGVSMGTQALTVTVTNDAVEQSLTGTPLATIDLAALDGGNGFVLNGVDANDQSGFSVSSAGDVNGDGFDDLIIGARNADPGGAGSAGESYVVFGTAGGFAASIDLSTLDGSTGFVLNGIDASDQSGVSVASAGDVNGDGFDDLIIGAYRADPGGVGNAGESYVVFGAAGGFAASLDLSSLDGSNGFVINGIDADDQSGVSVASTGDVNGDGFDDLIIGARSADPGGDSAAGESYVVFGAAGGFAASLDLSTLDGSTGFVINGIDADDRSGRSVASAGDVNGDGFDDLIIGGPFADPGGAGSAGESYVVFGATGGFAASLDLSTLDGSNGFTINGIDASDASGISVASAGDVNGDGFDDLIIGARNADPNGGDSGESYVVFGKASGFAASLDLSTLDGSNGFVINGIDASDQSGISVASAGDINGDGFDDLIIGARSADPGGDNLAGESYVVFGAAGGFAASLDLSSLDGSAGFVINGIDAGDESGISVASAGDINGDGFDDLIIGAYQADPNGSNSGESYLVFGGPSLTPVAFTSLATASFAENGTGVVRNIEATLGSGAADAGLTYSISGGADQALFSVDGTTGELSFVAAPDFEAPGDVGTDNIYNVEVTATDGGVSMGTQTLTITVTNDAAEAPVITLPVAPTVAEDAINVAVADTIDISDAEDDSQTVTLTITGGTASIGTTGLAFTTGDGTDDASLVFSGTITAVNTALDSLTFTPTTDLNGVGAGSIRIQTDDGNGGSDDQTVTFDITAVNDLPTVSGLVSDIALTEDTVGNIDLSASAFADVDSVGDVTVTLTANEGSFSTPVDGSGVGVTETLVNPTTVTLVGTVANINTYLNTASNVQYTGATDDNGDDTATVSVSVNDGDGSGDVGLGTVNLDIAAVNDAPTASASTVTMNEDTSRTFTAADFNFADVDAGDSLVSVRIDTLTVTSGTFRLSGATVAAGQVIAVADITAGNLVYTPAANANGAGLLSLTFSVNDGTAFAAAPSTLTVTVTDVAEEPVATPPEPEPDPVVVTGTTGSDTIEGDAGDDSLSGGGGGDDISGGGGDDSLAGDDGDDTISGGSGRDSLDGGPGEDRLTGGIGDDTLDGGPGDDTLEGGFSDDLLRGGTGNDRVLGGSGNDTLIGGDGNDTLDGEAGNDVIRGLADDDLLLGGDDDDALWSGAGSDEALGGEGDDQVGGGNDDDTLIGGVGSDTLYGSAGNDLLTGGEGDDLIFNGAGTDTVEGGTGNDSLWAGAGDDELTGGSGADAFIFGAVSGNDTVTDFDTGEDILNLEFASTDFTSLADVTAASTATTQGGQAGVLIDLGDSDSVFIVGIDIADLTESNVNF